jgi:transcriptional regulator with XRE-family HTH domain
MGPGASIMPAESSKPIEELTLGQNLRRLRRALGPDDVSQEELAQRIGVGPGAVVDWEKDRTKPQRHNSEQLAEKLDPEPFVMRQLGLIAFDVIGPSSQSLNPTRADLLNAVIASIAQGPINADSQWAIEYVARHLPKGS